ncbi:MAG: hypothetical protein ACSHW9_01755 [Salinibacterium amurskyense]
MKFVTGSAAGLLLYFGSGFGELVLRLHWGGTSIFFGFGFPNPNPTDIFVLLSVLSLSAALIFVLLAGNESIRVDLGSGALTLSLLLGLGWALGAPDNVSTITVALIAGIASSSYGTWLLVAVLWASLIWKLRRSRKAGA